MNNVFRNLSILAAVLANTSLDQLTKYIARENLAYQETINVLGEHLILTKIENSGAFLSAGDSWSATFKLIVLSVLPLLALIYGIYYLMRNPQLPKQLVTGISFVIGGGLGNLYDRLIYGSVTDFMHVDYYFIKTGIFNLADISIMIGMIFIIIQVYIRRRHPQLAETNPQ